MPFEVKLCFFLFVKCANVNLKRHSLCRCMTGGMRNLPSGYPGIDFQVQDRLSVGRNVNQQAALRYPVCSKNITVLWWKSSSLVCHSVVFLLIHR